MLDLRWIAPVRYSTPAAVLSNSTTPPPACEHSSIALPMASVQRVFPSGVPPASESLMVLCVGMTTSGGRGGGAYSAAPAKELSASTHAESRNEPFVFMRIPPGSLAEVAGK